MASVTCPKCRRVQYYVCNNPNCICYKRVPKNKLHQITQDDGEHSSCPYCGFTAHMDYWEERDMETLLRKEKVHSLTELAEKNRLGE